MSLSWQSGPTAAGEEALVDNRVQIVPKAYIRPVDERPALGPSHPVGCFRITGAGMIPIIDLARLNDSEDTLGRKQSVKAVARACEDWGFFQVVNHGVPEQVLDDILLLADEFFSLPSKEKTPYKCDKPGSASSSFLPHRNGVLDWREVAEHCFSGGLEEDGGGWPDEPQNYKHIVLRFQQATRCLAQRLVAAVAQNLGLHPDYIGGIAGNCTDVVSLARYPQCPEPQLVLGVGAHSDPCLIALHLQDDVGGLQVRAKNGQWLLVQPIPHAFVANIGDIVQVISNGRYPSVEHREVVNAIKPRHSVVTYHCPHPDSTISPAPQLTREDQPPRYKQFLFRDYLAALHSQGTCPTTKTLDSFYIT